MKLAGPYQQHAVFRGLEAYLLLDGNELVLLRLPTDQAKGGTLDAIGADVAEIRAKLGALTP